MPEPRKLRVFLCHASQDKPVVRELYQRLLAEGWIDPWLDEEKLLPGQDWDLEIEKAVEIADVVIVCLSDVSVEKEGYIQKELRFALNTALEKPEGTIFIIPLRLDECFVPRSIRNFQYIDYFPLSRQNEMYQQLMAGIEARARSLKMRNDGYKANDEYTIRNRLKVKRRSGEEVIKEIDKWYQDASKETILKEGAINTSSSLAKATLLLVTDDDHFARWITTVLNRRGYLVCYEKKESRNVLSIASKYACGFAVLDLELGKDYLIDLGQKLYDINPSIHLAFVSDIFSSSRLEESCPWLQELQPPSFELVVSRFEKFNQQQYRGGLSDKFEEVLARLTIEISAQATLILRKHSLWTYAGQISINAAKEMAVKLSHHWDAAKGSDLLRFVRLEATDGEYMVYTTRFIEDVAIVIVFDRETPFSTIRMQAGRLASWLK